MPETEYRVIDAQVHVYAADTAARPWSREPLPSWAPSGMHGPPEMTGAAMTEAMAEAGVDAAIIVSPWSIYRYDVSYALEVANARPEIFRVVAPIDPTSVNVQEAVASLAEERTVVGLRLMMHTGPMCKAALAGQFDHLFNSAADCALPIALMATDLEAVAGIVRRHSDVTFLLDHLGLRQPVTGPPPDQPFRGIDSLVGLAPLRNLFLKVTGIPTLSFSPFPFSDVWPHLLKVFDAFGLSRCAWGSDWTRTLERVTYRQGLEYITASSELSTSDKDQLLHRTVEAIYNWT